MPPIDKCPECNSRFLEVGDGLFGPYMVCTECRYWLDLDATEYDLYMAGASAEPSENSRRSSAA
ncbi:MAG: hypothetical protein WD208_09610 [Dehalococcoidia bacterium]